MTAERKTRKTKRVKTVSLGSLFTAILVMIVLFFQYQGEYKPCYVVEVIDGDTIKVDLGGEKYKVRLIGVNTPETNHPVKRVEPYGPEAKAFTKKILTGRKVYLEFDVQEKDRYGRLLAYVWLEKPSQITDDEIRTKMFNAILLLEGYAQVMTIQPNVKYVDYFLRYQREALEAGKGLWGLSVYRKSK
ncbi:micrococcal nuclease [Fervidobacterium changbaicum]|uniref:Thermonuclease family protein n=2 Tax=Fervidobacterium TaxID=2422 RepID=A0AAI8CMK6_FERIS|nr:MULTISPECIES: thermonuclease family protein [Fervidobacterium]AMW33250.1 thermonuclease family protein [Fervidobacterium islandicum]QAV33311.1 nuclease [Fervidobacterium changbaicum]SDH08301.1 micrococcal nuclease [Fervidobacterium changbaicum]